MDGLLNAGSGPAGVGLILPRHEGEIEWRCETIMLSNVAMRMKLHFESPRDPTTEPVRPPKSPIAETGSAKPNPLCKYIAGELDGKRTQCHRVSLDAFCESGLLFGMLRLGLTCAGCLLGLAEMFEESAWKLNSTFASCCVERFWLWVVVETDWNP